MNAFTIYSREACGWCEKSKSLLSSLGLAYTEKKLNVDYNRDQLWALVSPYHESGALLTVPQIWWGEQYIGGYEDLVSWLDERNMSNVTDNFT